MHQRSWIAVADCFAGLLVEEDHGVRRAAPAGIEGAGPPRLLQTPPAQAGRYGRTPAVATG
ncbi:hypothetical protein ACFYNL_20465 [Streptomyces sp. NPDC007808]|uniref:hypothetical protein n=1 Tax=Streptomyces sp. NPDC007808 TaxID=3364779 RepID=UPI00368EE481